MSVCAAQVPHNNMETSHKEGLWRDDKEIISLRVSRHDRIYPSMACIVDPRDGGSGLLIHFKKVSGSSCLIHFCKALPSTVYGIMATWISEWNIGRIELFLKKSFRQPDSLSQLLLLHEKHNKCKLSFAKVQWKWVSATWSKSLQHEADFDWQLTRFIKTFLVSRINKWNAKMQFWNSSCWIIWMLTSKCHENMLA